MLPGELHALKRGIILAVVILFAILVISFLASIQVGSELAPGFPYS